MAAYYNEIEPYAAQWLRNLIKAGHIADGEVDTRSIVDVHPFDLQGFDQCHFFAGVGGWSHALRLAGWPDSRPVWTGSCPCQPFSVAGKGAGVDDPRHLWPHFHRLIAAVRPPVVMGEQVAGQAGYGWLDGVRADLARENYASRGVDIPACAVDAPHIRQRLYWIAENLAYTDMPHGERSGVSGRVYAQHNHIDSRNVHSHMADADDTKRRQDGAGRDDHNRDQAGWNQDAGDFGACDPSFWSDYIWLTGADGKSRRSKSGLPLLAHGVSNRVGRLRAYGNAIVPPLAAEVIRALM